jgi:hypothetical protein
MLSQVIRLKRIEFRDDKLFYECALGIGCFFLTLRDGYLVTPSPHALITRPGGGLQIHFVLLKQIHFAHLTY